MNTTENLFYQQINSDVECFPQCVFNLHEEATLCSFIHNMKHLRNEVEDNNENPQNSQIENSNEQNIIIDTAYYPRFLIGDSNSPENAIDYEQIVYNHMCMSELSSLPTPRVIQTEITPHDRAMLVDWLCRLHYKCRLTTPAFFRCVGIIDRALLLVNVRQSELKLIGCAAMLIATKIEGRRKLLICHAIELAENAFSRDDLVNAEAQLLNLLNYRCDFPTSFMFLSHLFRMNEKTFKLVLFARYIIEVCASSIEFINVRPSAVACSAILLTRIINNLEPWPEEFAQYTLYDYNDLIGYARIIHSILIDKNREEIAFMRRKYGSQQFMCVANISLPCVI